MRDRPADAVVFVLLDAFRHDYLGRTRFLRQIARRSLVGQLEEPFGFCPRGAYFGGLSMAEQGYTNLYRYDPDHSPFRWTRELSTGSRDAHVLAEMRSRIAARARAEAPPFVAPYLDPLEIPLPWLSAFDASEREAPWSRRVGYRSLFHILEDQGETWTEVSWPYPNWMGPLSNERVAAMAFERLAEEHRFAYIHLPELDIKGHSYGPGSLEIQRALADTDQICELLTARISDLYRDPLIVFAGDHGMLPVVRSVNVAEVLARTGLRWGHDFAYFIDSTMVRCWFFTDRARAIVTEALAGTAGGHLVSADEQRRWGISGIDRRTFDEVYLADPGVVFAPNFFDWHGRGTLRGMHGYAPDVADNRALFLAHWPKRDRSGEAGIVEARRLFPSFLDWLGRDASAYTSVEPIEAGRPTRRARWSVKGDAASDAVIDAHLAEIVRAVRERSPGVEAVVLAGGFGRGEGTIVGRDAEARPVNDYDVVVVGGDGPSLTGLDKELARRLGIDFVELWNRPDLRNNGKLSQFDFDLRYGARLLWGSPLTLERLPLHAPAELRVDEGAFQIANRCGGLLLGLTGGGPGTDAPDQFFNRQAVKFFIALADAWLMAQADYHSSYVIRRQRVVDLGCHVFGPETHDAIVQAFTSKLDGSIRWRGPRVEVMPLAARALNELDVALGWHDDPAVFAEALRITTAQRICHDGPWLDVAGTSGLVLTSEGLADPPTAIARVFQACCELVRAWREPIPEQQTRLERTLAPYLDLTPTRDPVDASASVARTWMSFFHA